ncbi:MAG: hypothetical protein AAFP79_05125 [Pseudomonadota bacterium]
MRPQPRQTALRVIGRTHSEAIWMGRYNLQRQSFLARLLAILGVR